MSQRVYTAVFSALLLGGLVTGCGSSRRHAGTTAAAVSSGTAPTTSQPPTAPPGGPLTPAVIQAVARANAPQLRYNAYYNDGNTTRWNRNEDFFPLAVSRFLDQLVAGEAWVVVQESSGTSPGVAERRRFSDVAVYGGSFLGIYPKKIAGDPPGTAPLYVHVYDDVAQRLLASDGSGELTCYVEYWVFYAYDRAEAKLLNFIGGPDLTGHRADWEHTAFKAKVHLDPGGVFAGIDLQEGYYYSHGRGFRVGLADLERVDDQGQPDPQGTHPVVYVSQGKHASYPAAGQWRDSAFPSFLAEHIDFFRGNGVVIQGWSVPLIDLEDTVGNAAELNPPAHQALVARSNVNPGLLPDWTAYWGHWGPDIRILPIPTSATGPKAKSRYGDYGANLKSWKDAKQHPRIVLYKAAGITIPPTSPWPVPIRR